MSWSVTSIGPPAAVKAALIGQWAAARANPLVVNSPSQLATIGALQQAVTGQLDFLIAQGQAAVQVSASGSTLVTTLELIPVAGFVA